MSDGQPDYKKLVEARVQEEAAGQDQPAEEAGKLPLYFIIACLNANRLGDATLYTALHRGKFVFVKLWNRWLKWAGHHWEEDIDNECAMAAVEQVCQEYQRILIETEEGADGTKLSKQVIARCNVLRDVPAAPTASLICVQAKVYPASRSNIS